jgi:hypothetical protein
LLQEFQLLSHRGLTLFPPSFLRRAQLRRLVSENIQFLADTDFSRGPKRSFRGVFSNSLFHSHYSQATEEHSYLPYYLHIEDVPAPPRARDRNPRLRTKRRPSGSSVTTFSHLVDNPPLHVRTPAIHCLSHAAHTFHGRVGGSPSHTHTLPPSARRDNSLAGSKIQMLLHRSAGQCAAHHISSFNIFIRITYRAWSVLYFRSLFDKCQYTYLPQRSPACIGGFLLCSL